MTTTTKRTALEIEQEKIIDDALAAFIKEHRDDCKDAPNCTEEPDWSNFERVCEFLNRLNGELVIMFDTISNVYDASEGTTQVTYRPEALGMLVIFETDIQVNGHESADSIKEMLMDYVLQAQALDAKLAPMQLYTPEVAAALESVLDYAYDEEEKNFEESDAHGKASHIFKRYKVLNEFEHAIREARQ